MLEIVVKMLLATYALACALKFNANHRIEWLLHIVQRQPGSQTSKKCVRMNVTAVLTAQTKFTEHSWQHWSECLEEEPTTWNMRGWRWQRLIVSSVVHPLGHCKDTVVLDQCEAFWSRSCHMAQQPGRSSEWHPLCRHGASAWREPQTLNSPMLAQHCAFCHSNKDT